jgi:hypothetical protein
MVRAMIMRMRRASSFMTIVQDQAVKSTVNTDKRGLRTALQ